MCSWFLQSPEEQRGAWDSWCSVLASTSSHCSAVTNKNQNSYFLILFEVGVPLVIISKLRDPVTFALEVNIFDIYILMILIYFFYNFWAFLSLPVCLLCLEGRDDQQLAESLREASLSGSVYSSNKKIVIFDSWISFAGKVT